jgi:hypothetical protein
MGSWVGSMRVKYPFQQPTNHRQTDRYRQQVQDYRLQCSSGRRPSGAPAQKVVHSLDTKVETCAGASDRLSPCWTLERKTVAACGGIECPL